jgi:radical SAM protein with 4Fe4S-binding SPASM domain
METGPGLARWNLSTAEMIAVINDLGYNYPRAMLVFSGGEPLLRADVFSLADRARAVGLAASLATNGTLVTPELAARIATTGFSRVSVSLDGTRAETHDALRRIEGSFEQALRGLRLLRDAGQAVQINMSVTRRNVGEVEAMFRLAEAERAAALHVFIVVPVGCGAQLEESDRLSPAEYERFLHEFRRLSAATAIDTKATCAPQYARLTRDLVKREGGDDAAARSPGGVRRQAAGCLAGSGVCFINHRGEVYPCGYLPVRCGNVREMPLSQIWRTSTVFARLRQPDLLQGKCGDCDHRSICCGCRARAYAATGDYLAAEPDCLYQPKK